MADIAQLERALRKAHAAGDTAAAKRFAQAIREQQASGATEASPIPAVDPMRADLPEGVPEAARDSESGYTPSSVPFLDPINAFGTSLVENIPVVGGPLNDMGNRVDAWLASLIEGRDVSKEERARITQSEQEEFPVASVSGGLAGLVGPLGALSKIPAVARMLGVTGSLPARVLAGGGSGYALSGADVLTRGGSIEDALEAAGIGGGVGAGLPIIGRGVMNTLNALGAKVPAEFRHLARALSDDDIPVEQLPTKLREMGDDAMVMDLGPNLQSQAGALASVPGRAQKDIRTAVGNRKAGASGRVINDVAQTVGEGEDLMTLTNRITAEQSAAAKPLYDAIRLEPVYLDQYPAIKAVIATPLGSRALAKARELAANDGFMGNFDGTLGEATGNEFSVGLIDYMKRALDDIASSSGREGNRNIARQAANMARALTSALDAKIPAYKEARDAFAGPARVLDAIEAGDTIFTKEMSPAALRSMMEGMSSSEIDGLIAGAQGSIEAMMGNAVNDALSLRNTFRKGWNEHKLRVLLGDEIADDLLKRIDREAAFSETTNAVSRNSETARRQAAQMEVAPESSRLSGVSITGLILAALNKARAGLRGKFQPKVNARLAAALSAGSKELTPDMIEQIKRAGRPRPRELVAPGAVAVGSTGQQPLEITVPYGGL